MSNNSNPLKIVIVVFILLVQINSIYMIILHIKSKRRNDNLPGLFKKHEIAYFECEISNFTAYFIEVWLFKQPR